MAQMVGIVVRPGDQPVLADDAKRDVVLGPGERLGNDQRGAHAAFEPQRHRGVVVEVAARHDGAEIGGEPLHGAAGDVAEEMMRVRADVAEHERRAAALRRQLPP